MILNYINSDNSREKIQLKQVIDITKEWLYINAKNKKEFIQQFVPAFFSGQKMVLFDQNHKQLLQYYKNNDLHSFKNIDEVQKKSQLLFFTSGSSGFPVGAFKTKDNLLKEIEQSKKLFIDRGIKKVIVTVPFIHIYGILAGILLPMSLGEDIELIVKEDFLPYEILKEVGDGNALVITTPVFIKALGKLDPKILHETFFISSTGPLQNDDVALFEQKYKTPLMQLFGSTETGGIAYKIGVDDMWTSLGDVEVSQKDEKLQVSSPYISEYVLSEGKIQNVQLPFATEDIVKIDKNRFQLLGRCNKLIKIAGKRISATYIESILETIEGVEKTVVELVYKKELLRSEQILIKMQTKYPIDKAVIKAKIAQHFGVLTIPFKVEYIDKIELSAMGKKIIF